MNTAVHISLADYASVYRVTDVERALEETAPTQNGALQSFYEKMRKMGGERYIVRPSSTEGIDSLYDSCPNFKPVIDTLKKHMALAISGNEPMSFTPMLLLGEPGLGKTHFAKSAAKILGTSFEFISMSSLTAGWILSGASSQWSNAKPGKVAQSLINGDYANPVIALDEVDKCGGDHRYDPMGALYSLLEKETATHFKDEFVDIEIDTSRIMWIATANDDSRIPEPILNRMNVYTIDRPDFAGAMKIALALYRDILSEHQWGFPDEPEEEVLAIIANIPARDMRKMLIDAFGNAKLENRDYLLPQDIDTEKLSAQKTRIGFC